MQFDPNKRPRRRRGWRASDIIILVIMGLLMLFLINALIQSGS